MYVLINPPLKISQGGNVRSKPVCSGLDLECPPKAHVGKAWSPVQQCSEVGFWEVTGHQGSDLISSVAVPN
jgi:hypothetical protein